MRVTRRSVGMAAGIYRNLIARISAREPGRLWKLNKRITRKVKVQTKYNFNVHLQSVELMAMSPACLDCTCPSLQVKKCYSEAELP